MEPQIRYARTSDGVSIAYYTMGDGKPLIVTSPLGFSHVQLERRYEPLRAWYDRLAARRCLVRFDWRGQGLSQRNLSAYRQFGAPDIAAVVVALGRGPVGVLGCVGGGSHACEFAAAYPELISNLILWSAPADSGWGSVQVEATEALAEKDYVAFTEASAAAILGWSDPEAAHALAQFRRAAMSEEDFRTYNRTYEHVERDFAKVLASIRARTLVLHPAGMRNMPVANAQKLAAAIAGATLAITTDDRSGLPIGEQATTAIENFLDGGADQDAVGLVAPASSASHGTAVILFADIADSTALTERMGDAAFRAASRSLDELLRTAMRESGGVAVEGKLLGDGVLGVFTSAARAIEAARRCAGLSAASELPLHIGLHAGDVIREGDNVYGGAVNIASRICALCEPGDILVSQTVRDLARTSADVTFEDRGEHVLKGIADSVRVFAVRPGPVGEA